ncbi:MAG: formylglycine-generating enzyme family protein [Gammaproteobacteria bacterium]|nr:formylglycine-generating enzyme family protein [Gammaproteobacteria bacterium]
MRITAMRMILALAWVMWAGVPARAGQPTVSNLVAQQQAGTEVVQITYNLSETEGLPCWIYVMVDRDNLGSWIVPVHALVGDVGPGILPGNGKTILWNAGADYDHQYIPITKVKVVAHSLVGGIPEDMVLVPAGSYTMGSSTVGGVAIPEHTVYLDAYWMDKYEVTNREYKVFCDATGRAYPPDPGFTGMINYFTNYPSYPVVMVYWTDALAYAQWAGKRLPTEAEWERAAKGAADNRLWPWGNTFNASIGGTLYHANITGIEDGWQYTSPVGSYPTGLSPAGCYDMAGNVWEWVNDWYLNTYYSSSPTNNPQGPVSGTYRVIRGGYWNHTSSYARCAYRNNSTPTSRDYSIGFRCARTP